MASAPGARAGTNYVALAGEVFVLGELALHRLDGTLTLGQAKEVDILVLNRRTGRTFKVEVKTTEGRRRGSKLFGPHYSWLMSEKHGWITDRDLVYCFVLLDRRSRETTQRRLFLVPAVEVARYIRWNHRYWEEKGHRIGRSHKVSLLRQFRLPAEGEHVVVPRAWRPRRWRRWENNWRIFGTTHA